jgi:glycosyltransferase involved in cell wall biosynthesis
VHYKNFQALLQAYQTWPGRAEVSLVAVGEPWSRAEQQRLQAAGLVGRVRLLSGVDDQTLCRLYNTAAALVFPSLAEGFGLPLLEAMACGCPVVASRIPSSLEAAADCPLYFDPAIPETLPAVLDQALQEGRSPGRVQAGLERVKLFSWDRTARQTLEVYRQAWAGRGGPRGRDPGDE